MARGLIEALVPLIALLVVIVCARAWLARSANLKLSLFGPYKGDAWPVGVQEDDDFRFNWSPPAAPASTPFVEAPVGNVVTALDHESFADETLSGSLDELRGGSIALERLERISVRRIGH